ncbi:hypothetical protein [Nocardia uniformis]|uniref:hypothetical protein n=1 Tax=Nocardia uniformis TaxID=53432 RepID=UPI00082F9DDA|nr:hypothetical protein [Nocardia uniformis]
MSVGSGVAFELECERGSMPPAFFDAVEATVRRELARGPLRWPVPTEHTRFEPLRQPART